MKKALAAALIASSPVFAEHFVPGLSKPGLGQSMALTACQYAIKGVSLDQKATKVPYSKNFGDSSEFYFAWNSANPIRMPNKMGMQTIATGSCFVNPRTGGITSLSINGKTIY